MSFVAILAAAPDGRIGKYAGFDTLAAAQAHVVAFQAGYPDAFAVEAPAAPWPHWRIDMVAKSVTIDDAEFVAAEAERLAEEQCIVDLKADALRQEMIDKLTSATPQQISDYVRARIPDTETANMFIRILLVLAVAVRE